jgi:hypothetical protein
VGLLLPDTTAAHAAAVARRLSSTLPALAASSTASVDAIGFATRVPGQGVADGILTDARANAQRRRGTDPALTGAS